MLDTSKLPKGLFGQNYEAVRMSSPVASGIIFMFAAEAFYLVTTQRQVKKPTNPDYQQQIHCASMWADDKHVFLMDESVIRLPRQAPNLRLLVKMI